MKVTVFLYAQVMAFPFILAKNARTLSEWSCLTDSKSERLTLMATGMSFNFSHELTFSPRDCVSMASEYVIAKFVLTALK